MTPKVKIFFRADGNAQIGIGHVIRSLALADMLKEEFECYFIIQSPLSTLKKEVLKICSEIIELPTTSDYKSESEFLTTSVLLGEEIVVLDGYNFKTKYQQVLKNKGCKVICIDDICGYHFVADSIINHSGGINPTDYSTAKYTEFYLGLEYALLRESFRNAARNRTYYDRNENDIFICLGGADPNNDILGVLEVCEKINTNLSTYYVIIGQAYLFKKQLNDFLRTTNLKIELLSNLNDSQMLTYMKRCGIAITSPSSVSLEYLSVGGVLFLKTIADNQKRISTYLISERLAFDFEKDFPNRSKLSFESVTGKQKILFDGNQKKRFLRIFKYHSLKHRIANNEDCMLYYQWANDPFTRLQSFSRDTIPFQDHEKWFNQKIISRNSRLYIIIKRGHSIGQIRFDIRGGWATISYSIDKNFRGEGLGGLVLKKGIALLKSEFMDNIKIIGFVKMDNIASIKAFKRLGFTETVAETVEGSYKYTLE